MRNPGFRNNNSLEFRSFAFSSGVYALYSLSVFSVPSVANIFTYSLQCQTFPCKICGLRSRPQVRIVYNRRPFSLE